jgi:Methyltransferase domain
VDLVQMSACRTRRKYDADFWTAAGRCGHVDNHSGWEGDAMPLFELDSTQHRDMLNERGSQFARLLPVRVARAIRRELTRGGIYGLEWGDPDVWDPLRFVRDRYVLPFINPAHTAVEIGPGGGRWTRYLLAFKTVYAVDYYDEVLAEFRKTFSRYDHVRIVKNNGVDFPGIAPQSVDYALSFGCFVHLNQSLIDQYLGNLKTILKPGGNAVIHYSDKRKIMAQLNTGFADNTPEEMRALVLRHGYRIIQEDTTTMWHSSIVHFTV